MKVADRIIFNTVVLFVKIILTTLIALVSVPLILKALGADDYGLYNLVAGVVAMLLFLNSSMSIATQRYMSVAVGANDPERLNTIFNCACLLHLLIGLILVVVLEICGLFIFDDFLNIHPDRIPAAKTIYQFMILGVFLSVITVPYGAVINAKENMLAFAVIGIVDSVLKLLLALSLLLYGHDRLVFYGAGIVFISLCNVIFNRSYVRKKYTEFHFSPKKYFDVGVFKSMFGYSGWNVFGSIASIGRNQGIAVVMNLFLGTAINAAYGIANQVNGALCNLTTVCRKSINPQLMQSEGMGDRDRLRRLAFVLSKVSFIILACFAVPLIVEMPYVIKLWINDAPAYTVAFCQLILVLSMLQQYSNGLMSAVQAVGKIGFYQLVMGILLLLNVPICYILMKSGCPPYYCFVCFIVIETLSLFVRMLFSKSLANISLSSYSTKVLLPSLASAGIALIVTYPLHIIMHESFLRLVCVTLCYIIIYVVALWLFCFDKNEKTIVMDFIKNIKVLKK